MQSRQPFRVLWHQYVRYSKEQDKSFWVRQFLGFIFKAGGAACWRSEKNDYYFIVTIHYSRYFIAISFLFLCSIINYFIFFCGLISIWFTALLLQPYNQLVSHLWSTLNCTKQTLVTDEILIKFDVLFSPSPWHNGSHHASVSVVLL